jgi:hypothetical protein
MEICDKKKKRKQFKLYFLSQFLAIRTLDPYSLEMLDLDLMNPDPQNCFQPPPPPPSRKNTSF